MCFNDLKGTAPTLGTDDHDLPAVRKVSTSNSNNEKSIGKSKNSRKGHATTKDDLDFSNTITNERKPKANRLHVLGGRKSENNDLIQSQNEASLNKTTHRQRAAYDDGEALEPYRSNSMDGFGSDPTTATASGHGHGLGGFPNADSTALSHHHQGSLNTGLGSGPGLAAAPTPLAEQNRLELEEKRKIAEGRQKEKQLKEEEKKEKKKKKAKGQNLIFDFGSEAMRSGG